MFSDILTPLTAAGIEWDVVRGKGPQVYTDLNTKEAVEALRPFDPDALPFMRPIINTLADACENKCTLLGESMLMSRKLIPINGSRSR